jgi:hypothetical protein
MNAIIQQPLVERMHARVPSIPMTPMDMLSSAIERGADIATIKELMALRKELELEESKQAFDGAMKDAQAEMVPVVKDKDNAQTKSKYASYAALDRAVRPIYTKYGFSLTFDTGNADDTSEVRMLCDVSRDGRYTRQYHIDMPADGKGAKGGDVMTKTHATGSATRYGMRYLLIMIFNIAIADKADDDGNAAAQLDYERVSEKQLADLRDLIEATGANLERFLTYIKLDSLANLRADKFDDAVKLIKQIKQKERV